MESSYMGFTWLSRKAIGLLMLLASIYTCVLFAHSMLGLGPAPGHNHCIYQLMLRLLLALTWQA